MAPSTPPKLGPSASLPSLPYRAGNGAMRLGTYPLPSPKMSVTGVHNFFLTRPSPPTSAPPPAPDSPSPPTLHQPRLHQKVRNLQLGLEL